MARRARTGAAAGLLLAVVLAGCGGGPPERAAPPASAAPGTAGPAAGGEAAGAAAPGGTGRCPVTRPRPWRPPPGVAADALFGSGVAHGNGKLWVGGLADGGVIAGGPGPDGTLGRKLGWWRGVAGSLRIEGRRLDGPAPPLRAHVPDGYGDRGFQASGVFFPTGGCWEVTGRVGSASLTFVTLVAGSGRRP
jgi:hypothetical protein